MPKVLDLTVLANPAMVMKSIVYANNAMALTYCDFRCNLNIDPTEKLYWVKEFGPYT